MASVPRTIDARYSRKDRELMADAGVGEDIAETSEAAGLLRQSPL
jgi:hypothetical protein